MFKMIALLKRRPDMPVTAFQDRWRTGHAPLVAAIPGLRRHVQSHALEKGYAKGELLFDGIAESWFDSEAAFRSACTSEAYVAAEQDLERFVDPSRTVRMAVEVHVIKDGAIPANGVKNIEFVNRRPGMAIDPFRAYWLDVHGPIAAKIPVLRRYEQNHISRAAYQDGKPAYDGLAITWFASTADMKAGTETEAYAVTRADEPNFLPDGHLPIIITREHEIVAGGGHPER